MKIKAKILHYFTEWMHKQYTVSFSFLSKFNHLVHIRQHSAILHSCWEYYIHGAHAGNGEKEVG